MKQSRSQVRQISLASPALVQEEQPGIAHGFVGDGDAVPHELPEFWGTNPPLQVKQVATPKFTLHEVQFATN